MKKLAFGLIIGAMMLTTEARAVDPSRDFNEYVYRPFGQREGVGDTSTISIIQTGDGYLWLGTQNGLARYNGKASTIFTNVSTEGKLAGNLIEDLFEDSNLGLWVATDAGLSNYVGDNEFRSYADVPELAGTPLTAIAEDSKKRLWLGSSRKGLIVKDGDSFAPFGQNSSLPSQTVGAILVDSRGITWVGTAKGIAWIADGILSVPDKMASLAGETIVTLTEDRDGNVWIGMERGLAQWDGGTLRRFGVEDGLPSLSVICASADPHGVVWIGTTGGLARIRNGKIETDKGIKEFTLQINSVYTDREDNLWFFSIGAGFMQARNGKIHTMTPIDTAATNAVWSILESSPGVLWYATQFGVVREEQGQTRVFGVADGTPSNTAHSVQKAIDGGVWVGFSGGGISHFKDDTLTHLHNAPDWPFPNTRSLWQDETGTLWVGTANAGFMRFSPQGELLEHIGIDEGLPGPRVNSIHPAKAGGVWLSTSGGLVRFESGVMHSALSGAEMPPMFALSVIEDESEVMWINTATSGLGVIADNELSLFTTAHGLPSNAIYALQPDEVGNLWGGTDKGIFRVSKDDLLTAAKSEAQSIPIAIFTTADGLTSSDCSGGVYPVSARTSDGRFLFPMVNGVGVVSPGRITSNETPPITHIENVTANNIDISRDAVLEPGAYNMEFQFAGLSYMVPEEVRFKYKLEGFDHDWSAETADSSVRYTNLDPGDYEFKVMASNNDGVWDEAGVAMRFEIEPHWYQRSVTWILAAMLAAVLGYIVFRRRELALMKRNAELSKLAWNRTRKVLEEQMQVIRKLTGDASGVSGELKKLMEELAASSDQMVSAVEETVSTMRTMEHSSEDAVGKSNEIVTASLETQEISDQGQKSIMGSIEKMLALKNESQNVAHKTENLIESLAKVDTITMMVRALSERSKILAINASIEASKVGRAGFGFGVVATSMKNLALESQESTLKIAKLLDTVRKSAEDIGNATEGGVEQTVESAEAVSNHGKLVNVLTQKVQSNSNLADAVSAQITQQLAGLKQIGAAISQFSAAASKNRDMSQEISKNSAQLDDAISKLNKTLDTWQTPEFYKD